MEKKLSLTWDIYNGELERLDRYCHNCGKKVEFIDSLKRRQNANGRNIFHFAIYKCPKGHTWNKGLNTFKAMPGLENGDGQFNVREMKYDQFQMGRLVEEGIHEIEIYLNVLQQKVRIDKFLSSKINDMTRTQLTRLIDDGFVRINGKPAKAKTNLKENDILTLQLTPITKEQSLQ